MTNHSLPLSVIHTLCSLSYLLLLYRSAGTARKFAALFPGFDYQTGYRLWTDDTGNVAILLHGGRSTSEFITANIEDLFRMSYPDYAAKAQEFFRVHAPELLR